LAAPVNFFLTVAQRTHSLAAHRALILPGTNSEVLRMRTNSLAAVPVDTRDNAVRAEIDFLVPSAERLFAYGREAPRGGEAETVRFASRAVRIEDVRDGEPPALDEHGAMLGSWPTRVRRFYDDSHVQNRYYPESADIIRTALGADRVIVFDHNVRRGAALQPAAQPQSIGRPVHHAHTDYTPRSALQRLRQELGPRAEEGLSRYLQVNLWRPIRGPVRDAPLAMCDGSTVKAHSLRTVELRYADRTGEIYYLLHAPGQRWFFASDMTVEEAWLFKNFDSASPGPGRVAPHSAFTDTRYAQVSPRESIEVRALAIFH
jgi:hypothetical protein